jgi:hypothetical protein
MAGRFGMIESVYTALSRFLGLLAASVVSLAKVVVGLRYVSALPVVQNQICSVLGNGPSLSESLATQLDFIRKTEIVCVNNFAHAAVFTDLKPANYVISDPNYFLFTDHTTDRPDIRQTLTTLLTVVDWPMTLYVPHFAKKSYVTEQISMKNPRINIVYFNYTVVTGFPWLAHRLIRAGLGMIQAQTVIVAAMTLMVNRGFSTIYLFGADTSWHEQIRLDENNQLTLKQLHFYERPQDVTHQPVYSDAQRKRTFSMAAQFLSLHKVFRGYELLRDYADFRDVNILNASAKSYIDAFDTEVVSLKS